MDWSGTSKREYGGEEMRRGGVAVLTAFCSIKGNVTRISLCTVTHPSRPCHLATPLRTKKP